MPWRQRAYTTSDLCSASLQPNQPFAPPFVTCVPPVVPDMPEATKHVIEAAWDLVQPQVQAPPGPQSQPQDQAQWLPVLDIGVTTGNVPVTQQHTTKDPVCYQAMLNGGLDSFSATPVVPNEPPCLNTPLQLSLPNVHSSPKKRSCTSHARKRDPGHVKRPCNAFILFRSHAVANQLIPKEVERDHRNISRIISYMWRSLSPEERRMWDIAAENERERHRQLHPDYKYRPSSRRANIHRRNHRQTSGTERQCEHIADAILKACGREGIKKDIEKEATAEIKHNFRCTEPSGASEAPELWSSEADNVCASNPRVFLPRRSSSAPPITPHLLELIRPPGETPDSQAHLSSVDLQAQPNNILGPAFSPRLPVQRNVASDAESTTLSSISGLPFGADSHEQLVSQLTLSPEQLLNHDTNFSTTIDIEQSMENFSLGPAAVAEVHGTKDQPDTSSYPSPSRRSMSEISAAAKSEDEADLWAQLLSTFNDRPQAPLEVMKYDIGSSHLSTGALGSPGLSVPLNWNCVQPCSPEQYNLVSPTMRVP